MRPFLPAALLLAFAAAAPAAAQKGGQACPTNGMNLSRPVQCSCSAAATAAGSIYGTDIYSSDSAPCLAARHAGAIGPSGGDITIIAAPGQQSYQSTRRNGVMSESWGPWPASFTIGGTAGANRPSGTGKR